MTLHLLKDAHSETALTLIRQQAAESPEPTRLLLIQEAVGLKVHLDPPAETFVLKEDLEERGLSSPYTAVDMRRMLDLIFEARQVLTW